MPYARPTVVIVGRPNVGKSTLFNRITGQRRAIVGDEPGITRDRIHGFAEHDGRRFEVIDTGGIVVDDREYIPGQILRQAQVALESATHIIFLVDGRAEITAADRDLAAMLRKLGKPVSLAVNKADTGSRQDLAHQFYELGIPDVFPISGEHGTGVDALLDRVLADTPAEIPGAAAGPNAPPDHIKVAIIGRPNVGKSTLLNALTGAERAIVSPIAGTTRDAVDETVTRDGVEYVFIDTAGIRRKGKTKAMAEKLSVVMARRHIRMAHVVLLVLDATEGVVGLDATIAGYAHEGGRGIVVCVNKWDEVEGHKGQKRNEFERKIRDQFKFLEYAPVAFLSAKTGAGVERLFPLIREVYESASRRIPTGELNRFVEQLRFEERKIYYMTQASIRPPEFVAFTDRGGPLHFSHERYLVNQIRRRFGFRGTPIVFKTRAKGAEQER
ncbi:MAG TPA: ribosome biogenesis GTPase Der [Bryobacteraceae bacterium]|jgi:GTP-binding protein|nr:ribosome biogenesis GTPase Der [Bryobacteraceae bacterium]